MITFVSYASDIKRLAGRIKKYLDEYGFGCFLAHENIEPQLKWPKEIEDNLEKCDLFLPLLTPEYRDSFYCQQETGYAYCNGVEILPILISDEPMGLIYDLQGIKFEKKRFEESCWKIVDHVARNPSLSEPILDALIKEFGKSTGYDEACEKANKILNEFDFTPAQVKAIKRHIKENPQINRTKKARDCIFEFMDRYPKIFDKDFVKWYDKKSKTHMRY